MNHNYEDIVMLERYLEHSLNEEETRTIEKRLADEPALKELYQNEKLLVSGIRFAHLKEKQAQLKAVEARLTQGNQAAVTDEKQARIINFRTHWKPMAAAAALLLAVLAFLIFRSDGIPQNERLYAANFEPFDSPGSGLTRSEANAQLTWKAKGYEAYDNGSYRDAVGLFEKALLENDDPIVKLCLGNAYLATGHPDNAEQMFISILDNHQDLVTQAKWYLSLAYLKQNKLEKAKSNLWEISKSSTYGEKARKLLKELN